MKDAYHDAIKIQAVATCQKLRIMAQIFTIDEKVVGSLNFSNGREQTQVFKYEDNDFHENFFCSYNPAILNEAKQKNTGPPNPNAVGSRP